MFRKAFPFIYFAILFQHQTIFCEYVQSGDYETFPLRQRTLTFKMIENEDITSSYINRVPKTPAPHLWPFGILIKSLTCIFQHTTVSRIWRP